MLFNVHWGNPLSVLLVVVLLGISIAALAVIIGTWSRSQEQAIATAVIVAIIAGMLGGCVYQLDTVSTTVKNVGHIVPQAWAMDAFVKLISDHATFADTLPEIGALAVFAVVLSTLAVWYYSRKVFSTHVSGQTRARPLQQWSRDGAPVTDSRPDGPGRPGHVRRSLPPLRRAPSHAAPCPGRTPSRCWAAPATC